MTDEEIIERLTKVRGIGRWTVEMLLLFELGRLDVWPVADYGVQKGFAKTFGRRKLPTPKQFQKIGEKCGRNRPIAARNSGPAPTPPAPNRKTRACSIISPLLAA